MYPGCGLSRNFLRGRNAWTTGSRTASADLRPMRVGGGARGREVDSPRQMIRHMIGRDRPVWLRLGTPRLRYRAFGDIVDTALFSVIRGLRDVEFLQIGANDGRTNDPLWAFRRFRCCRGVLVEPLDSAYRRLMDNYEPFWNRYRFVNAAVGAMDGMVDLHSFAGPEGAPPGYEQLGSLKRKLVESHASRLPNVTSPIHSTRIRCLTFQTLCAKFELDRIDILHVDAEGSEAEILMTSDFSRWKPHLVLFEHVHLTPSEYESVRARLAAAGFCTHRLDTDTLAMRLNSFARIPGLTFVRGLLEGRRRSGLVAEGNAR